MAQTSADQDLSWAKRFKQERRRRIKRAGKRLTRALGDFLGRQSLVGDTPILDNKHFPFLESFTDNWETIRAELEKILVHREAIPGFQDVSPDQYRKTFA